MIAPREDSVGISGSVIEVAFDLVYIVNACSRMFMMKMDEESMKKLLVEIMMVALCKEEEKDTASQGLMEVCAEVAPEDMFHEALNVLGELLKGVDDE
jgi:endonuclease III